MTERIITDSNGRKHIINEPFKPDYNTEAVLVEEMQRMAKRIEDLEKSVECMYGICKLGHQRKPLTDEQMFKIWLTVPAEINDRFAFARAIEAAHGIGDKT